MKTWILEKQAAIEERPLKLARAPVPRPREGEVRIKVLVCGICRTDIHIAEGDLRLKKSPVVLGHEIVGIVDEVGRNVDRFHVGDKVGVYWLYETCGECKHCRAGRENYCPEVKCTGWDVDGGYAEYVTAPAAYALPLNDVEMEPAEIAPLMCPGIAGYAAFKLTGAQKGDKLGLYGYGPTAYYVLKVAQYLGIDIYVSTRSPKNIAAARQAGATWAADTAKERIPCRLDAAILFPPAGNLVEPILAQLESGGTLVMAPVSSSPIVIQDYSANLWGRDIKTLYNLKRADAEGFLDLAQRLDLEIGTSRFSFEELQDALILVKRGELKNPNAVVELTDRIR